jgi:hypothetical protein
MFALLAALPFVGGLIGRANRIVVELLAWGALAAAIAIAGAVAYERVYDRGVAAERGHTLAAQAERDLWRNRAVQAEATAADNERAALALGGALTDQAEAYDRADAQARADADRYTRALEAARSTRCVAGPDPVRQVLTGRVSPAEDAPLPMSLREAVKSLRKGGHR